MLITRYNCFNTTTKYPDFMFAFHHSQCGQNEERMRQGARWGENPDWLSIVQLQKNYSTIFTCWPCLWYVDHISGMSSTPSIPGHRKNLYSLLCLVSTFNSFCNHALDEPRRQKEIWGDLRKVLTKSMKVEIYIYTFHFDKNIFYASLQIPRYWCHCLSIVAFFIGPPYTVMIPTFNRLAEIMLFT